MTSDRITRVVFIPANTSNYNYLIDSVTFTGILEPSSIVLLGIGAVSLLIYGWRQKEGT